MNTKCSSIVDVESCPAVKQQGSSCRAWSLRCLLGILALCVAAVVLVTLQKQVVNKGEQENDLRHTLRQISQNAKAAIHLEGEYNPDVSTTSAEWRDEEGQSFTQGELSLEKNEIIVHKAGLYFVYSQASFRVNCHMESPLSNEQFVHISHTVMRWSESYGSVSKPLLSAVRSACKKVTGGPDNGERWFNAIYLGAVFNLNAGDRLSTITKNHLQDMEGEDGKTFFGVFAL